MSPKTRTLLALLVLLLAAPLAVDAAALSANGDPSTAPAIRLGTVPLSRAEVDIWNDATFRQQFAQSYLAETEIEPSVTQDERKKMLEVMDLFSEDRMDKAESLLRKNINDASSAVFDFTLANIYFQSDRWNEAAKGYEEAVKKFPKFRRAWKHLGLIHVRQGDLAKALPPLRKVVELGGGDAVTYGLLGFAYSSTGNDLSAESAYRMANLLAPETRDWKMGLARSFFKQERYAEAAALCGNLIEESPDSADLWLLQANAFLGLNQPLRAAENYEFVDRLGKSTGDSLNMLADIYVNQELYDLAVDTYAKAVEKDRSGTLKRALRASKLMTARGALDSTKRLIGQIEPLFAENAEQATPEELEQRKDLLKLRARLAVADGAGDEEARVLEEIVALDPLDGEALILLGKHASRNDETERAIFYFERAESLEAFEADAKVEHAQVLVRKGRYAQALPLLRRAQLLKPREAVQEFIEQIERLAKS